MDEERNKEFEYGAVATHWSLCQISGWSIMDLFVPLRRIAGQRAIDIENVECHDAER